MALTDIQARQAKAKTKDYKLSDKEGLYLFITTSGSKYWRAKYRYAGKEKTLSLGVYPKVTLTQARSDLAKAKLKLKENTDPNKLKKNARDKLKAAHQNTFKAISLEWHHKQNDLAPTTLKKRLWILENKLFPLIGHEPIAQITPPQMLRALRKLESTGNIETMQKTKQVAGQVFRYAVAIGMADSDPTRDLKDALSTKKVKHHAAVTEPKEVGKLLVAIENYDGTLVVQSLLAITPLLFQRPGELRQMEWKEVDIENQQWEIPAEKMKMRQAHIVPLCRQAIAILEKLHPLTGKGRYVFTCQGKRDKPASESAVTRALRHMGYTGQQMTAHGFRAMGRTILDEVLEFPPHLIEQQISHAVRDPLGRAYNRTAHLKQRKEMMQRWADYLDALKAEAKNGNVVAGKFYRKG